MSLACGRILAQVIDFGPIRIGDLAERERSSQPTITNHIKRLEADGLVTRQADRADARVWLITATDKGKQELNAMRRQVGVNVAPQLDRPTAAERASLRDGIAVMRKLMVARPGSENGSGAGLTDH